MSGRASIPLHACYSYHLLDVHSQLCVESRGQTTETTISEPSRVELNHPIPPLDTGQYQLPVPTSDTPMEELSAAVVKNTKMQLEHQRVRFGCSVYSDILS